MINNCKEIEIALDAYHDGEASPDECELIAQHVSSCADCQRKLADIQVVVARLKSLPRQELSRDIAEQMDSLLASKPVAAGNNVIRPWFWGSVGVAAAAAVIFLSFKGVWLSPSLIARAPVSGSGQIASGTQHPAPLGAVMHSDDRLARLDGLSGKQNTASGKKTADESENLAVVPEALSGKRMASAGTSEETSNSDLDNATAGSDDVTYVALSEGDQGAASEAMGISTDEDGLYAIKL